jgi:hypothetical protein
MRAKPKLRNSERVSGNLELRNSGKPDQEAAKQLLPENPFLIS